MNCQDCGKVVIAQTSYVLSGDRYCDACYERLIFMANRSRDTQGKAAYRQMLRNSSPRKRDQR